MVDRRRVADPRRIRRVADEGKQVEPGEQGGGEGERSPPRRPRSAPPSDHEEDDREDPADAKAEEGRRQHQPEALGAARVDLRRRGRDLPLGGGDVAVVVDDRLVQRALVLARHPLRVEGDRAVDDRLGDEQGEKPDQQPGDQPRDHPPEEMGAHAHQWQGNPSRCRPSCISSWT